jgi:uncharacterized protein YndB with AHSA1/START domain
MSETVSLDVELKSPIERVWQALTDSSLLSKWTFFETNDFQPVVGHKFQFRSQPGPGWTGIVDCEVLAADKPHRLSYTWVTGPEGLVVHTTVTWTLTEADKGVTRLHLEQSGFASEAAQAIGGAKYGWTRMVEQLRGLLPAA